MTPDRVKERVLIHTPFGRDGSLIQEVLHRGGIASCVCAQIGDLEKSVPQDADAVIVGDEALGAPVVERLADRLKTQPTWSDLPLIVMTSGGMETDRSRARLRLLEPLGNVTLVERPVRPVTLVSSVRGALRARRRQYEIRDLLAQRQLDANTIQQSNEELRLANSELQQFAYSASHDLQEPLRMVSIYSELLRKKYAAKLDDQADEFIGYLVEGATRMDQLLKDLLSYTQVTSSNEKSPALTAANQALDRAILNLRARIEHTGATIERGDLPVLPMHEVHLQQLFQNLIGNALKYRREEKPRVIVQAQQQKDSWIVSVADNGIGVEQQYADLIFGIFKRLHNSEAYPGTGIGLAICKKIVERYRGRIWVESEVGRGSTFYFSIPNHGPAYLASKSSDAELMQ